MFNKKFSVAYPSFTEDPSLFYNILKTSSQQYRDEIFDIYFSYSYKYIFNDNAYSYGDVMAASINDEHLEFLFKIQDELNINISITFNETYPNRELTDDFSVLNGFIKHLKKFYDRGLRSCTISHVHLMALGILQNEFPEMLWKNTVNHIITTPQQVIDYHLLGYNVINLDRSLNRNIDILRKMQPLRTKYPKLILSLLVSEGCMPNCPFKVEHDTMNKNVGWNYWSAHGNISCTKWRQQQYNDLPRIGTEMVWGNKDTFKQYSDLVDYFKFSGRLSSLPSQVKDINQKFIWSNIEYIQGQRFSTAFLNFNDIIENKDLKYSFYDSFTELYNDPNVEILHNYKHFRFVSSSFKNDKNDREIDKDSIWLTKKGKILNKILTNCRNECWDCHACEDTFGIPHFDSLIEINRNVNYLQGHSSHFNTNFKDI